MKFTQKEIDFFKSEGKKSLKIIGFILIVASFIYIIHHFKLT
jgi:hypothetical protein